MTWPMTKKKMPNEMSPSGQRSSSVPTTRMIWLTTYTKRKMAFTMYVTTKMPTGFLGSSPAQLLKVRRFTAPPMMNMASEQRRRSQTESVVPSSYSWKPTKPLISKQVHSADTRPFWAAAKYGYAAEPGAATPASRTSDMMVRSR
jgi:hypothetical protein